MRPLCRNPGYVASIWNDIQGQRQGDILMTPEAIAIIPEIIFGVHGSVVEGGIFSALNDLVPQYHLVDFVIGGLVFRRHVEEELFDVPIEQWGEVCLEIERQKSEVVLFSRCAVIPM